MTAESDVEELRSRYLNCPSEELLKILYTSQAYRPEAVQLVREVLATRDQGEIARLSEQVKAKLLEDQRSRQQASEEPLTLSAKLLCVIFCGVPGILYATVQANKGRRRRAREAWQSILIGWAIRFFFLLMAL